MDSILTSAATLENSIDVQQYSAEQWPLVEPLWSELVIAATPSYFLSSSWMKLWLEVYGRSLDSKILVFEASGTPVAACVVSSAKSSLTRLALRRITLNASGEPSADTTYVEFNNLLSRPGWEVPAAEALVDYLLKQEWDELALEGFLDGSVLETLTRGLSFCERQETCHPSYYVDLAAIRSAGVAYETVLKSSNRKHLKQNLRYYSEIGPLQFSRAEDVQAGLEMFEELAVLSQQRSDALGRRGIFASSRFVEFHRRLISDRLLAGDVQLFRLQAGSGTVGVIYNLVSFGKIYFYQCGYRYTDDKRLSPGTVTLFHVIEHCIREGFDHFDFLSGEAKYKEWMSTGQRELRWASFQKADFRFRIIDRLRGMKRAIQR